MRGWFSGFRFSEKRVKENLSALPALCSGVHSPGCASPGVRGCSAPGVMVPFVVRGRPAKSVCPCRAAGSAHAAGAMRAGGVKSERSCGAEPNTGAAMCVPAVSPPQAARQASKERSGAPSRCCHSQPAGPQYTSRCRESGCPRPWRCICARTARQCRRCTQGCRLLCCCGSFR